MAAVAVESLNVKATPAFDTMLAAYVLNPGRSTYRLEDIARAFLGETLRVPLREVVGIVIGRGWRIIALSGALTVLRRFLEWHRG